MGLFSSKCTKCDAAVKKTARFCRKCGTPAPKGWFKSPSGHWVGVESVYDPHTGDELRPEEREMFTTHGWRRTPGVFAQQADWELIRGRIKDLLVVEEGTQVVVQTGGITHKILFPGQHRLDSVLDAFKIFGRKGPRRLTFIETAPFGLALRCEELKTKEDMSVHLVAEILLRLDEEGASAFVTNFLGKERMVAVSQIEKRILGEIIMAARDLASVAPIDDLVRDPALRLSLEDKLRDVLSKALSEIGLVLERVGSVEFTGPAYERLRVQSGESEELRRRLELEQLVRDRLLKESKGKAKAEFDVEEFTRNLAHERDIEEESLGHTLEVLKQRGFQELDAEKQAHELEKHSRQMANEFEMKRKEHELETQMAEVDHKRNVDETADWNDAKKQKRLMELEVEKERMAAYGGADLQTLIAALPDERSSALLKLNEQSLKAGMKPEQILALAVENNPSAAAALKELLSSEKETLKERLQEQKKSAEQWADRLEQVMRESLAAMGDASKKGPVFLRDRLN